MAEQVQDPKVEPAVPMTQCMGCGKPIPIHRVNCWECADIALDRAEDEVDEC